MGRTIDNDPEALRKVLAAVPEIVIVLDPSGTIQYINRVEEGFVRDEVIGSEAEAIMLPESREVFRTTLESVLESGVAEEYESKVLTPEGNIRWYRSRMRPLRRNGEIVAVMLLTTNISELKATKERVSKLQRLFPICSWCDRIRNEDGDWETIEQYISRESDTRVTHGLCPDCQEREFGNEGPDLNGKNGSAA